jgi:3-hydroxyisobutyrate dehydrogenase
MLMQRVAILGLGIMGGGMAANWLAKGFEVSVWNRTAAKAQALAAKGAKVSATPRDAAQGADFIFAMVSDDDASRSVWLGPDGALAGAKSGAIGVESSTLTPGWIRELAHEAQAKGVDFLDAPVGGSRPAADSGELRFFVGGDPKTYEAARPALAAVGSRMDLLGPLGAGATWKLINNQLGAGQIAALAEALEVAKKAGFKSEQISELILGGPAASPMVKLKLPRMLAQDFEPADFALNLMLKDARYAAALAQSFGTPAGMIEGAVKAFARADAKGLGAKDIAAVVG